MTPLSIFSIKASAYYGRVSARVLLLFGNFTPPLTLFNIHNKKLTTGASHNEVRLFARMLSAAPIFFIYHNLNFTQK